MSFVYDQKKIDALASELMELQRLADGGPPDVPPTSKFRKAAAAVQAARSIGDEPLEGAPTRANVPNIGEVMLGKNREAEEAARRASAMSGVPYRPTTRFAPLDVDRATRIAREYDLMKHDPDDPLVKMAYDQMIKETNDQYEAMLQAGIEPYFIEPGNNPYRNSPYEALLDVAENRRIGVFPSVEGFGTDPNFNPQGNPLLQETGRLISGRPALANDLFRAVHDYFGHAKPGVGFRAAGEENAYQSHAGMYSPLARRALASETRGQNSYLNYGPYGETNRTAKIEDTRFADQKAGLMPRWASEAGLVINDDRRREFFDNLARNQTGLEGAISDDGKLRLIHYSTRPLERIDPEFYGRGLSRASLAERNRSYDPEFIKRSYYGIPASEKPYVPEFGLGGIRNEVLIEPELIYQAQANPEGLWIRNDPTGSERRIAEAGYTGYYSTDPKLGKVAVIFDPYDVSKSYMIPVGAVGAGAMAMSGEDELETMAGGGAIRKAAEAIRGAAKSAGEALDMSAEGRKRRAAQQGFNVDEVLYHGTDKSFENFIPKRGLSGTASYLTPDADIASAYAMGDVRGKKRGDGANILPAYVRGNILSQQDLTRGQEIDIWKAIEDYELANAELGTLKYEMLTDKKFPSMSESLLETTEEEYVPDFVQMMEKLAEIKRTEDILGGLGYTGVRGLEELINARNRPGLREYESIAVFDPKNIRSVNARFNPLDIDSSNILSGLGAAAIGAGALTSEDDPEGMSKGGLVDKLRSAASSVKEAGNVYKAAVGNMFSPFEPVEPQLGDPNDYEFPELRLRRPGIVNLAIGMPNMPADMRYLFGDIKDAVIGDEVPDEEWRRFDTATEAQGRYEDDMDAFLRAYTGKSMDELSGPMSAVLGVSEALAQPGIIPAKLVAGLPRAARYLSNLAEFATPVTVASPGAMLTGAGFNAGIRALPALTDGDDLEQMNARYSGRELSGEEQDRLDDYLQELLGKKDGMAETERLAGGGAIRKAAEAIGAANKSASNRPVDEQIGLSRAKSMVEQSGQRWDDVKQISTPEEYLQFQRRYGLASVVSERDEPSDVFHRGGSMFYDEETGKPVAYATSSASRKKPEGMANGGLVYDANRINALAAQLMEPVRLSEGGPPPRSRIARAAAAIRGAATPPREIPDEQRVSDEEMMRIARDLGIDVDETIIPSDAPIQPARRTGYGRSTIRGAGRKTIPGIYDDPREIVERASRAVAPESEAMQQLFGVTREDLADIAMSRAPTNYLPPGAPARPRGTDYAELVMQPANTNRLVDILGESLDSPLRPGMTGWYIFDPVYNRLKELVGEDEAQKMFLDLNTLTGVHSANAAVANELTRGSAMNWLNREGRLDDYLRFGGKAGLPGSPIDMATIPGHMAHKTAHVVPALRYLETGELSREAKTPAYIASSTPPELGTNINFPVGDAHFVRGIGLSDVRPETKDPTSRFASWSMPEAMQLSDWFARDVARRAGLPGVPGQALLWGALSPTTGVKSKIGAPKLEILSDLIMQTANRLRITPEEARDMVLTGKAYAGKAEGGLAKYSEMMRGV